MRDAGGTPRAIRRRGSIARNALVRIAGRIAVVIIGASVFSYFHLVRTLEEQSLSKLSKYVQERGDRESAMFQLAEDNHTTLEQAVLATLTQEREQVVSQAFEERFQRQADGITRNRAATYDGTREAGVYVDRDLEIDTELQRRVLAFQDVINQYGPAWHNRFEDTYITTPQNVMVIYWPEVPNWCQEAGPDLDMPSEEYVWVADKEHNPQRETVWTGLFYDHVAKVWMVSCETPVDVGDEHVATLGHDILLNELFERTMGEQLEGTYNLIFRDDGRLIAHPRLLEEIQAQGGAYDIAESGQEHLKSLAKTVRAMPPGQVIVEHEGHDEFLAATRIAGPDWYFVTVFPRDILASHAMGAVRILAAVSLLSLLLEVILLYLVLRGQVAKPLETFVQATHRVAKGEQTVEVDSARDDEIGQLASSFNAMVAEIAERDHQLLAYNEELSQRGERLEQQVRERTAKLEGTLGELETARIDAVAASRTKSEFLANMSHEIRTPMTAIMGFAESLAEELQGTESEPAIHTIQRNGTYLLSILNDILDLTKVEAGRVSVEILPLNPTALLEEVVSLMQVRADAKGLTLGLEIEGPLPETIESDPTRLRQVLINLMGNAIKFTHEGGVRLLARFVPAGLGEERRAFLEFDVVDTGVGIDPDQSSKLFQAFEQADASTTRQYGGTGLGLTISRRLAQLLGGDVILVHSAPGAGACFRVSVAVGRFGELASASKERALAQTEAVQGMEPLSGLRVLLVEDGRDNQVLISMILRKQGAEVTVEGNGKLGMESALDAFERKTPFDVILMDMQMPVMDGYEAASELRRCGYPGAIVALTAHTMAEDRQKCLDAGCDEYATKPIERQAFFTAIQVAREQRGLPSRPA